MMNTFNRVVIVLSLVGLVVILALGLVMPAAALAALGEGFRALEALAVDSFGLYLAVVTGLLLLALALLLLEVRRPRRLTVKVQHVGGSVIELSTESVARGLEYHIAQVPGVLEVRPGVVSTGKAVRVTLDLETDPAMAVPAKSEEVIQLAREIIEGKLGLKLAKVSANIRQAAYGSGVPAVASHEGVAQNPAAGAMPSPSQDAPESPWA